MSRSIQHEAFADKLDELKFYKYWDDIETHNAITNFIDDNTITYWGVACCLFDHLVSYASYFDTLGGNKPWDITLEHINGIISDYMRELTK